MKQLTKRQAEILDSIQQFSQEHGYAPSYRELMKIFGLSSISSIFKHIKSLENKGYISQNERQWRSMSLIGDYPTQAIQTDTQPLLEAKRLPIIGSVAKDTAIELFPKVLEAAFPSHLIQTDLPCYGFIIKDHSFQEECMQQDDLIAIEVRDQPKNDETILVTMPNGHAFIGKFSIEKRRVQIGTTIAKEEEIHFHGTVIALIRGYNASS